MNRYQPATRNFSASRNVWAGIGRFNCFPRDCLHGVYLTPILRHKDKKSPESSLRASIAGVERLRCFFLPPFGGFQQVHQIGDFPTGDPSHQRPLRATGVLTLLTLFSAPKGTTIMQHGSPESSFFPNGLQKDSARSLCELRIPCKCLKRVVARDGIEPPPPAFSGMSDQQLTENPL